MLTAHAPVAGSPPPRAQHAVAWVLRDSRAIYCAASEGIINLADKAFDMDRADSLRWGRGMGILARSVQLSMLQYRLGAPEGHNRSHP